MKSIDLPVLALALALAASAALARDYKIGSLEVAHPWTRATPKGSVIAGGYVTIKNTGTVPDRLVGGSTPVAGRIEVHEMAMNRGVMTMRHLKDGLEIKPGQTVELKPGSTHLMLSDLTRPLEKGQQVKGTLIFEKAGTLDIEYTVEGLGATVPMHENH